MATVNKNFRIKDGLIVEGTTGTINGSDIITEEKIVGGSQTNIAVTYNPTTGMVDFAAENGVADSTTDDLTEGNTNKYFTAQRAVDAVVESAASTDTPSTIVLRDSNGDFSGRIVSADVAFALPNGGLQGGSGLPELTLSSDASNVAIRATSAQASIYLASSYGDIVLHTDTGAAYIGTASISTNQIATQGYVDTAIGNLPANYITAVDTNVFNVDSGTLQLNSVVSAPGTEVHISKLELHLPDDTNLGAVVAHPYDGSLTVAAINQLNLESHSGDINIDPQSGNVYVSGNITTTGTNNITASNNLYAGSGEIIGGADYGNDGFLQIKDANGITNVYVGASNNGASLEIHGSQTFYASINDGGTQYGNISYDGGKNLVINGNYNDVILQSDSGYAYIGNNNSPATRIATQAYVDATSQGLNVKQSVKAAANSYADLGVLVDGITLVTGDRVLAIANDQNDGGIYVATVVDGVATFVRSDDQQTPTVGDFVFVESGYTHHAQGWILSTVLNGYQVWTQFSAAGEYTAGTGITLDGNAISVTANTYDTYGAASTAESNAKSYADTNFVNVADLPGQLSDYVLLTEKGQALGVATLDADGQVPAEQLGNVPANYITSVGDNLIVGAPAGPAGKLNITSTPTFSEVYYGSSSSTIASTTATKHSITATQTAEVFSEVGNGFEVIIKAKSTSTSDLEITKLLVLLDADGNVYATEYANITTNTDLFNVTFDSQSWYGGTIKLKINIEAISQNIDVSTVVTVIE
jgi:hypothetical protein